MGIPYKSMEEINREVESNYLPASATKYLIQPLVEKLGIPLDHVQRLQIARLVEATYEIGVSDGKERAALALRKLIMQLS